MGEGEVKHLMWWYKVMNLSAFLRLAAFASHALKHIIEPHSRMASSPQETTLIKKLNHPKNADSVILGEIYPWGNIISVLLDFVKNGNFEFFLDFDCSIV